jgi:DNA repair photolyase
MGLKTVIGDHGAAHKGRGATINPEGRFESLQREAFDDGWDAEPQEGPGRPKTTVTPERAKSIITRNDSPDIPFTSSINPYRGCEHGCIYCLSGDTPILMGDGRTRQLAAVKPGDLVYGTARLGWYRRYVKGRVLAHWRTIKQAYRIILEDGTCFVAGADHRFLTERGWKFVGQTHPFDGRQRPCLTRNNKLMGTGAYAALPNKNREYRAGYLCGVIRGDGLLASYRYQRVGRQNGDQHQFRLALCDQEALDRTGEFLREWEIETEAFLFQTAVAGRREMRAIRTHARWHVDRIRELIAWPARPSPEWSAGFLAGIFDAEGSYSQDILRVSNTDDEIISWTCRCLQAFDFQFSVEHGDQGRTRPIQVVRVTGGLREHLRFFHSTDPAISRKREVVGQALKSSAQLKVTSIEPLGKVMALYDITTETGDFMANGVVSHNCYARPSHAYLGLSPGLDFETRLFAKVNAAELLRDALAKPGYRCESITVGANTDPYQPVEREWRITRQVLEVLAECDHPVALITKNALVERDLDLLAPMAAKRLAQVYVSVTTLDHDIARRMEPRASAPRRRLEAISALSRAGVPTGVMVAPIVPFLTDDAMESVLEAAAEAGAIRAGYILMRLPWELKDLFQDWLEHHYPLKAAHVMSRVRQLRGGKDNDPNFGTRLRGTGLLAELLRKRFENACQRLGLNHARRSLDIDTSRFKRPQTSGQLDLF